jgi:microcystin degradation protein MlrC
VFFAQKPRIAIASFGIESSTFSPALTEEEAFHPKYGTDVFTSYPFLSDTSAIRSRAIWFPTVAARSLPGGAVTREAYESIVNKIIERLKKTCHTMPFSLICMVL